MSSPDDDGTGAAPPPPPSPSPDAPATEASTPAAESHSPRESVDAFEAEASVGSVDELYGHIPTAPPHQHLPEPPIEPAVIVASEVTRAGEADEQLIPPDADLRDAVGAAPAHARAKAKAARAADDEPAPTRRNRKLFTIAALSMLGILIITTFALLGHVNAQRYAIACSTDHVRPERGRSFPPWGTQPMLGPQWKPIALALNAECKPRETDNVTQLEGWYLDMLVDSTSTALNTPNVLEAPAAAKPGVNPLDVVSDQLNQALLLSRAPEHHDQRKEVERLLGDVQYWRASLRLRDATAALLDASKQFEAAAGQRPRYVTDAAAWASYVKKLADDLHAGPNGAPAAQSVPTTASGDHPSAPMGTQLPVEPEPQAAGSDAPPPPPAPDAGVPTGGVLL